MHHLASVLEKLCKFITKFRRENTAFKTLPNEIIDIVNIAHDLLDDYAYDPATIPLKDLEIHAFEMDVRSDGWNKFLATFRDLDPSIKLVKSEIALD